MRLVFSRLCLISRTTIPADHISDAAEILDLGLNGNHMKRCKSAMEFLVRRRVQAALQILFAFWAIETSIVGVEGADPDHLVTNLPGAPAGLNLTQYAGYVTANEGNGRALFYWFFRADHPDASSKPLAIWLNGGPGCSSVGAGLLKELGPFYPAQELDNTKLMLNPSTWIKETNIIFLESPVSVGFSYSNTSSDYSSFTDLQTAQDSLQFLLNWYEKFPEYKGNDFYLLGESYAGHYVPTFAREIVHYNDKQGSDQTRIKFKGFVVGNPWTDAFFNNKGAVDWWHSRDLISETYETLLRYCNFSMDLPVVSSDDNPLCANTSESAGTQNFALISMYNIHKPVCNAEPTHSTATKLVRSSSSTEKSLRFQRVGSSTDPCSPDLITPWLNSKEVKQALHVRTDIIWSICSESAQYNYSSSDILESMLPVYEELLSRGLRIWIYNGDQDGVCPTTTTRYALEAMKLEVETPWYPWEHETQVGGYAEVYKGLTFATVRAAGHFVPVDQPGRALALLHHFLAGSFLPSFPPTS